MNKKITGLQFLVLKLIAESFTVKQIAKAFNRSPRTIEKHKRNGMRKIGLSCDADICRYMIVKGCIDITE